MLQTFFLFTGEVAVADIISAMPIIPAYIDPNTGGMLFQILAVLFGVISGALLLFSGKIKGLYYRVRRRFQETDAEVMEEGGSQPEDEA